MCINPRTHQAPGPITLRTELEKRLADVAMPDEIRVALLRHAQTRATVLRPNTAESMVNDLLPFDEFLHTHHPT